MLDVNIDRNAGPPLHEQVAAQIRRAIAEGEAGPGERLPLAKDLAAVLGVNKNTVLRALHLLREEGLLEFRRGRGITVAGTPQHGAVLTQVRQLLAFARQQGYGRTEVIQMITDLPQDDYQRGGRPGGRRIDDDGPAYGARRAVEGRATSWVLCQWECPCRRPGTYGYQRPRPGNAPPAPKNARLERADKTMSGKALIA